LTIKLTRAGLAVTTASDGSEGLAAAVADPPDVVLADATMSPVSAEALASELHRRLGRARPAIVFLTSDFEPADLERALRSGADDCICKPFSPADVLQRLQVVQLRRQLAAEAHYPHLQDPA
jgi:DNA-binding response OmpR family regulator